MPRRAAVHDNQPPLFGEIETPAPPTPPLPPAPARPRNRRHILGLPRPWPKGHHCDPKCLTCGHEEADGTCPDGCLTVCTRPPHRRAPNGKRLPTPVEVCLITTTVQTRIAQGASAYQQAGRRLAVAACPRCGRVNWHRPSPGRAYRIGQCGHPYVTTEGNTR